MAILLNVADGATTADLQCSIKDTEMELRDKNGKVLFVGEFFQPIDAELSTWTIVTSK